jgi:hypothetical protein
LELSGIVIHNEKELVDNDNIYIEENWNGEQKERLTSKWLRYPWLESKMCPENNFPLSDKH